MGDEKKFFEIFDILSKDHIEKIKSLLDAIEPEKIKQIMQMVQIEEDAIVIRIPREK